MIYLRSKVTLKSYVFVNLAILMVILPRCCSDKADDNYEYVPAASRLDSTFTQGLNYGNLGAEPLFDNKKNKEDILHLPQNYSNDPNFEPPIMGAVTAVCVDPMNNLHVMHRADRIWDANTFNYKNQFNQKDKGPITTDIIYTLNRSTGAILKQWGKNLFYLPHGLTVDRLNNAFVTDVAMHQVFKFNLNISSEQPSLTLGEAFVPGSKIGQFCKPTAVAVLPDGKFFVADGYCNARIIQYTESGIYYKHWGKHSFQGYSISPTPEATFAIPHGLTLIEEIDKAPLLCVADRENGRVQCFNANTREYVVQYHSPVIGNRLFSVAYAKGNLFVVNGPELFSDSNIYHEVGGFVIDMSTAKVTSKFNYNGNALSNPHDIAVTSDKTEVYVAELDPNRILKFVLTNSTNRTNIIIKKNIMTSESQSIPSIDAPLNMKPEVTVMLVCVIVFSFCLMASGLVAIISKRRQRGKSGLSDQMNDRDIVYSRLMGDKNVDFD